MELIISGNVQTVISGNVTESSLHRVSMKEMHYGLGGAGKVIDGILEIGETIVYEGVGYIYTVRQQWKEKDFVYAPFLIGIASKPSQEIEVGEVDSLEVLYGKLLKDYPAGFVVIGECLFSNLAVAFLKRSPIYGENINTLHDKYWENENLTDCTANLFGVVLPKPDPRIFYSNPNEVKSNAFPSHTHALVNGHARHMLTHSSILSGKIWIEAIH